MNFVKLLEMPCLLIDLEYFIYIEIHVHHFMYMYINIFNVNKNFSNNRFPKKYNGKP